MPTVAELIDIEALRKLAPPDAYDWGVEASNRGDVRLECLESFRVAGRVQDQPPREAELRNEDGTLQWTCSCEESDPSLCRHGVAVAVETWRRTPPALGD